MHLQPPQKTIRELLGPSIIFIALSISGGELLLWPDLISRYGLTLLVFIPAVLLLQFSVNMEIERYTAATGKSTLPALIAAHPWITILFPAAIIISLMWPAWISTAGNIFAISVGQDAYGAHIAAGLLCLLLLLWQSKKSYMIIERVARIGLIAVLGIVLYTLYTLFDGRVIHASLKNGSWFPEGADALLFISALAYGGVAGVLNLVQSDWIKSKGYAVAGMDAPENIAWNSAQTTISWRSWWRLMTREHALLFLCGNILGITLLGALAALMLPGSGATGFGILAYQVQTLNTIAYPIGSAFGVGVCLIFIMAQMAILDACGRLLKHCMSTSHSISHERLSQCIGIIGIIIILITIAVPSFNQPSLLLQISAAISAGIMAVYPPLLLRINKTLPLPTRPRARHHAGIWLCTIFYASMTCWALFHILS
jgi:hypothetical protein